MKRTCTKAVLYLIGIISVIGLSLPAGASSVYVGGGGMQRYGSDGSNGITVRNPAVSGGVVGIADDPLNDEVYFWEYSGSYKTLFHDNDPSINDGTGSDLNILKSYNESRLHNGRMDFDPLSRTLYFTEMWLGRNPYTAIRSLNVDTNSWGTLYSASTSTNQVQDLVVDPVNEYIYWTDSGADTVNRRSLNGTGTTEVLYSGLINPYGIALDANAGTLFWTEWGDSSNGYDFFIQSANLNGTGSPVSLISFDGTSGGTPVYASLDVDPAAEKIYFTGEGSYTQVKTMDYNGRNVQNFTTPSGSQIYGNLIDVSTTANLAVVPEPISSTLFIIGGASLGLRRFRNKLKK